MGIFGKIFGKKEDHLDLDRSLPDEKELNLDSDLPTENIGLDGKPIFPEDTIDEHQKPAAFKEANQQQTSSPGSSQRDLELINSKLDTLKAILNSMDQRIANLEKAAGVEQQKRMPW